MKKTCIIIAGPTASGKTSLAITLARYFDAPIVSADSRQCYTELNIAVAKPSAAQLNAVPHYFINSHSIHEPFSAADYEAYALKTVAMLFQTHDIVVMVGGTGLYIKAFCEGLDEIPAVDETIRKDIISSYELHGIAWLQEKIKETDPAFFATGELQNPYRLMRALEVFLSSGKSITCFQSKQKKERPFNMIKIGLQLPREQLYERINSRVDDMIDEGLVEEAKNLLPYRHFSALQTVGYRELFAYFDGKSSLEEAVTLIKQNTRHYAKRQMTWFKKDELVFWVNPADEKKIISHIHEMLTG